ncbi:MAG: hydantoinase/oxoprolinase family protein [Candidatus Bathyarchaeota archaeon]|nr:hydantoinase/oxoprolinase family protein [Candidatus Bathyarchaeota archaeon]
MGVGGQSVYRVSVDVGGTFTDLVAMDEETGRVINIKVPTEPKNPEGGVLLALRRFLEGRNPSSVGMMGHATTIATNALFGQVDLKLPRTAFVTTAGFRDVVEIGRQRRAEVYNLFFQRPPMLVGRRDRHVVRERMDHEGNVLTPLNMEDLRGAVEKIRGNGVESVALGFLNSYVNPAHEERAYEVLREALPDIPITVSSRVSSGYREYERFSTAVVNATLIPIIRTYISRIASGLKGLGVASPLYVMQSNGGMAASELVSEKPVTIVESGPASGVIASAWLGGLLGRDEVISFDMGGTTAKAGTVRGMVPEVVQEYEVAGKVHLGRLLKGSGYPVSFPFIDLAECSAGGGTIAWADEAGGLNVGPVSAGAEPGPACYGRGGGDFTLTDANLVLGRLNPGSLLGGEMEIRPELAGEAAERLGDRLGMEPEETAASVVRIADSIVSQILRIVSVERGYDPRRFTLVAFGGAGPMHACSLAEGLEIDEIVVPPNPGMFSALGLLTADLFHDLSRALITLVERADAGEVEALFEEMEAEGREILSSEGVAPGEMRLRRQMDVRYYGQSYEITVDYPEGPLKDRIQRAVKAFHGRHGEIYGYSDEAEPVELVNLRLRAVGLIRKPELREIPQGSGKPSPAGVRSVYFEGSDAWVETPIYDRVDLGAGSVFQGPAIVEQYDSTTVVYPGWKGELDRFGVLNLGRGA